MTTGRPTLLVFARHGESVLNVLSKGQPFCPDEKTATEVQKAPSRLVHLTEQGTYQARSLGETLACFPPFDVVIHSGYVRAQQTAELAMESFPVRPKVIVDPRFREREGGYSYGMTRERFNQQFPYMDEYWKRTGWFFARPVGGESLCDIYEGRIHSALTEVLTTYSVQRVLIVGHGRCGQVMQLWLEGRSVMGEKCPLPEIPNCGILAYEWDANLQIKRLVL